MSSEECTLSRLRIRNTRPRWARIVQGMIREKKKAEGKEKPAVREEEEEEDAVHLDTDVSEEKALKEKENVEQKTKQKVAVFSCKIQCKQMIFVHRNVGSIHLL